jgi:hypothetical protein
MSVQGLHGSAGWLDACPRACRPTAVDATRADTPSCRADAGDQTEAVDDREFAGHSGSTMALDPFRALPLQELKSRGPKVVFDLVEIVQHRAEANEEAWIDTAARLPKAWFATVLVAHVAARLDEGEFFPTIAADVTDDARTLLLGALREIKEGAIADSFEEATTVDLEDETEWSNLGPPEPDELARLKKKLFMLVTTMNAPFPASV